MAITKVSPGLLDLDSGITITVTDNSDNLSLVSTCLLYTSDAADE